MSRIGGAYYQVWKQSYVPNFGHLTAVGLRTNSKERDKIGKKAKYLKYLMHATKFVQKSRQTLILPQNSLLCIVTSTCCGLVVQLVVQPVVNKSTTNRSKWSLGFICFHAVQSLVSESYNIPTLDIPSRKRNLT